MKRILLAILGVALLISTAGALQAPQVAPASQQPSDVSTTISSEAAGTPPRFAVPDFIPLSKDAETVNAARAIAEVLWNDLN